MEPLDGENERVTRQGRRARHAVQRKRYKHPLRLTLGILPLASLLIGCAVSPAPASISASYVSSIPYQSWTCSQLRQEQSSLDAALSSASTQQDQMRSNERVHSALSMLVPLPPDTGFGDVTLQVDIAHLKGEQEAVRQAMMHDACPTQGPQQTSAG